MKHASHKATTVSRQKFSLAKALFASGKGSHSVRAVRAVQSAGSDAVVLGLDPAIAEKINEIAPQTRSWLIRPRRPRRLSASAM